MFFRIAQRHLRCSTIQRQIFSPVNITQTRFLSNNSSDSSNNSNQADIIKQFIKLAQSIEKTKPAEQYVESVPEGYEDPNSLSKNPIFMTVPVGSASSDQEQYRGIDKDNISAPESSSKPGLVQDTEDSSIFYNKASNVIGEIDTRIVMAMKCDVCNTQLVKSMSKLSYTKGVVIVRCDGCKNLHLIADNLGWLDEKSINIEQIMREKGQEVLRTSTENPSDLSPEQLQRIEEVIHKASEKDLDASIHGVVKDKSS